VIAAVEGLIAELRTVGIPISAAEYADAVTALRHIDLGMRASVKTALGTALVKDARHESAYSVVFDLYFALRDARTDGGAAASGDDGQPSAGPDGAGPHGAGPPGAGPGGSGAGGGGGGGVLDALDDEALAGLLLRALEANEAGLLRALAAAAVTRYAAFQPGRAVAGNYYLYRTMRAVGQDTLTARLLAQSPEAGAADGFAATLLAEEYERRVTDFQREVEAEIRRRLVADRGAADVARTLRRPLPEDTDFLTASTAQITALREIVQPMARKLAARLAERQRHRRRGALDFRRTVRESMSTGGVPMTPVFRPPVPTKPELVILADISGSVSAFAEFTLHLTYALRAEFTRVRSFVFVDAADEVTEILAAADDIAAATAQINARGCGVWLDGRSDYGNALRGFRDRYGPQLRSRATVLVLGDARANYHASGAEALKELARRAGHLFWLNPEPSAAWDSGDSVMREYAAYCDAVIECRNVRQLRAFIEQLVLRQFGAAEAGPQRERCGDGPLRTSVHGLLAHG
jgi:uncharacterized protein with von Willebrand factor type A (vWA) domain